MISSISGMGSSMAAMQGAKARPSQEDLFNKIDTDGDGSVNATEVQSMADMMAEKMGDAAPTADELMAQIDSDGDGAMSFAEFEAGRPQGPPSGPPPGPPPGEEEESLLSSLSFSASGETDLSSLFSIGEEEDVSSYESIYA